MLKVGTKAIIIDPNKIKEEKSKLAITAKSKWLPGMHKKTAIIKGLYEDVVHQNNQFKELRGLYVVEVHDLSPTLISCIVDKYGQHKPNWYLLPESALEPINK